MEGARGQWKAEITREFKSQSQAEMQPRSIMVSTVDDNNNHNIPESLEFSEKSNDIKKVILGNKTSPLY